MDPASPCSHLPPPGHLTMGLKWMSKPLSLPNLLHPPLLLFLLSLLLLLSPASASATPGSTDYNYGAHPRFVCTPIPADADPACFPTGGPPIGGPGPTLPGGGPPNGWWGMTEEAKATILHLRESLVQQKETILNQRETIRELTAKLTLCEGFGRGAVAQDDHNGPPSYSPLNGNQNPYPNNGYHGNTGGHHNNNRRKEKHVTPGEMAKSLEQKSRMLQALKERLENLQQSRNTSATYSGSLKELLQRKIAALEQQMQTAALSGPDNYDDDGSHRDDGDDHHDDEHHDDHHDDGDNDDEHHDDDDDDHHDNEADSLGYPPRASYRTQGPRAGLHSTKLETVLNQLHNTGSSRKKAKSPEAFQIGFPMRTNYMYGRVKRTLLHEIFALTLCLWMKTGAGPLGGGVGTPFSYSVPGQANELVLIEWGNNPMELLVDDKAVTLPLSLSDGKWHHVCVTWSTRDGQWEAYQDGVKRGSGENLSPWHPIKPGGVFILGQEQDTLGGRFDATQSFVGEISDLQMWSQVLPANDIFGLASCASHLSGDVIAWSEAVVELHGGVTKYPFDPCH